MEGRDVHADDTAVRPWPGIFTQPRRAIRAAIDARQWWPFLVMPLAYGGGWLLREVTGTHAPPVEGGPDVPWTDEQHTLLIALGIGLYPLIAFGLPWLIGRMFGGRGTLLDVFVAVVWAALPITLVQLVLECVTVARFGAADPVQAFSIAEPATFLSLDPVAQGLLVASTAVGLWSLGLQVVALSEAHRISGTRAFFVVLLPLLLLFMLGVIAAIAAALLVASLHAGGG